MNLFWCIEIVYVKILSLNGSSEKRESHFPFQNMVKWFAMGDGDSLEFPCIWLYSTVFECLKCYGKMEDF